MYMSTQDMYDVAAAGQLDKKVAAIKSLLKRSLSEKGYRLYLNHASGYSKKTSIFGYSFSSYEGVQECARTCNKAFIDYMKGKTGPMGFVMMDFAGDDEYQGQELIDVIINNCYNTCVKEHDENDGIVKGNTEMKDNKTTFSLGEKAVLFDLSGRKISVPEKGLFVVDGQKILYP